MRLKKFTAIAAASVCAFGLASGVAQAVPRPIKTDSSGVVTGSYLYNQYAAMGPYKHCCHGEESAVRPCLHDVYPDAEGPP